MKEEPGAVSGTLPSPAWRMLLDSAMCGDFRIFVLRMVEVSQCLILDLFDPDYSSNFLAQIPNSLSPLTLTPCYYDFNGKEQVKTFLLENSIHVCHKSGAWFCICLYFIYEEISRNITL